MGRKEKIKQLKDFLKSEIWVINPEEFGKRKARTTRHIKVFIMTLTTFSNQKVGYRATSLAFFSTIALIPCVALTFAVTKGFGIGDKLEELLLLNFSAKEDIIRQVLQYANNVIEVTNKGAFGIISFLSFIWLVFWLMIQVEKAFNYVWRVKESRSLIKRISVYFAISFLVPLVLVMFLSTTLMFSQSNGLVSSLVDIPFMDKISAGLSWAITYVGIAIVLTFMYKFIPGTKVNFRRALQAALITAVMFCLFQWIYVETQVFFTRLNGVFGAVAAIPFLMIWLNVSWFIVLFGSELTFAFQHVETYNPRLDSDS